MEGAPEEASRPKINVSLLSSIWNQSYETYK